MTSLLLSPQVSDHEREMEVMKRAFAEERRQLERGHAWRLSQERTRLQEALQWLRSATPALRDLRSKVHCPEPGSEIEFGQIAQSHKYLLPEW